MREQLKAATVKAEELWATFTDNEKHGVRFGLFPGAKITAAEAEGIDLRQLTLALMVCADKDGGMRA